MADLKEHVWRIKHRAARLERMVALRAPEIIIEWMRRGLAKSVAAFPVDPEIAKMCDESDEQIAKDQAEWERNHGSDGTANSARDDGTGAKS